MRVRECVESWNQMELSLEELTAKLQEIPGRYPNHADFQCSLFVSQDGEWEFEISGSRQETTAERERRLRKADTMRKRKKVAMAKKHERERLRYDRLKKECDRLKARLERRPIPDGSE